MPKQKGAIAMEKEIYTISSPEDLLQYKNTMEQETITPQTKSADASIIWLLTRDIDMTGIEWSPIDMTSWGVKTQTVLDGDGHKIKGLYSRPVIDYSPCCEQIAPCAAAKKVISVKPSGLLFLNQYRVDIRGLTVEGTLDLRGIFRGLNTRVSAGGLSGILDGSSTDGCEVNTDVILPEDDLKDSLRFGGIAGANQGCIVDSTCRVTIQQHGEIESAGVAYYNSGLIKNSYTQPKMYPETGREQFSMTRKNNWIYRPHSGLVDNIELYLPGGPCYTGRLEKFFRSKMLKELVNKDIQLGLNIENSYWNTDVINKIAHVVEALASTGAKFGLENEGAAGLSICPFRDYSSSHSTAADIKLCRTRYSLMLQRLVQESPTFRRGLLEEYDDDPDWVMEVISDHISSLKCAESILNMAKKYRNYDEAVQADQDFIDSIFDR